MKTGQKREKHPCPHCGRVVAFMYSGRSAAPSQPMRHNCPHGNPCMGVMHSGFEFMSLTCSDCNESMEERRNNAREWTSKKRSA